ncbi:MAG TPA: MASE3 domain-containing protein, partial [Longimicrobiales bacterium]|nr:MASE3 domain-containing protein [Longimicrobiales bacterium]
MASPDALTPGAPVTEAGPGSQPLPGPASASSPFQRALEGPDQTRERSAVLTVILVVLLWGAYFLRDTAWQSTAELHTLMEAVATLLAFMVGALSLVRFYSRRQATFLLIGTGFLGAGLLDLNHTLLTSGYFAMRQGIGAEDLFAWSWIAERVFLSVFLLYSLHAWRQESRDGEGTAVHERSIYVTALVLTMVNLLFFGLVPLRGAHIQAFHVNRPGELLPGLFFLGAFVGYLRKGSWRREAFDYWLLVALLISTLLHLAFMSRSGVRFDGMFDAAHLLKVVGYVAVLTGLLYSVYQTFRGEAEVLGALTEANEALAREVTVRAQTEQAVKEGRARLQDFLDNANDLIQSVAL